MIAVTCAHGIAAQSGEQILFLKALSEHASGYIVYDTHNDG